MSIDEGRRASPDKKATVATMIRQSAISLVVVLAIALGIIFLDSGKGGEATAINVTGSGERPKVGDQAPDFVGKTTQGQAVRLSDLQGNPVWINFWASWCPPCRAEMPDVQAAYEARKSSGLTLLAISVGEDPEIARAYAESLGVTAIVIGDSDQAIASRYRINGLPTHIFIDSNGVIQSVQVGGMSKDSIFKRVDPLLGR